MKKTETKTIVKIATAVFVVFLAINYWPNISGIIRKILSAAMPLLIGCVIAYPLSVFGY